ncbi:MAG: hypothetical protein PHU85_19415 [Phycisphaerae bacterium]|nr:hypothetical protein [Phycisphaerae bacterium]
MPNLSGRPDAAVILTALLFALILAAPPAAADDLPALASEPTTAPDAAAEAVAASQQDLLDGVVDGEPLTRHLAACELLIQRLDDFPLSMTRPVTYSQLMQDPDGLRGAPVRMMLRVFNPDPVRDKMAFPSKVREMYQYTGIAEEGRRQRGIVLLSTFPRPKMVKNDSFEVVGYLFKVARFSRSGEAGTVDSPVLVVYQYNPAVIAAARPTGPSAGKTIAYVASALLLLMVWMLIRRKLSAGSAASRMPQYRPMRYDMTPEEVERTKLVLPPDPPPPPSPNERR